MAEHPMPPHNNKQEWCAAGEQMEESFAGPIFKSGAAVFPNPAKKADKCSHDLFIVLPADLKTVRTQFRTADRYGIPSATAVALNKKDVDRYASLYPDIIIIWDIDIPGFRSRRYAPLKDILKAIERGFAKLHIYQDRVDDQQGNAKESYLFDARWFREL